MQGDKSQDKELIWFSGEVKTPPFSSKARIEAGYLLRLLQKRKSLSMPQSRPMLGIGSRCHELRINDRDKTWRIVYRIDEDAIIVIDVFTKKTNKTPEVVIPNPVGRGYFKSPPKSPKSGGLNRRSIVTFINRI